MKGDSGRVASVAPSAHCLDPFYHNLSRVPANFNVHRIPPACRNIMPLEMGTTSQHTLRFLDVCSIQDWINITTHWPCYHNKLYDSARRLRSQSLLYRCVSASISQSIDLLLQHPFYFHRMSGSSQVLNICVLASIDLIFQFISVVLLQLSVKVGTLYPIQFVVALLTPL